MDNNDQIQFEVKSNLNEQSQYKPNYKHLRGKYIRKRRIYSKKPFIDKILREKKLRLETQRQIESFIKKGKPTKMHNKNIQNNKIYNCVICKQLIPKSQEQRCHYCKSPYHGQCFAQVKQCLECNKQLVPKIRSSPRIKTIEKIRLKTNFKTYNMSRIQSYEQNLHMGKRVSDINFIEKYPYYIQQGRVSYPVQDKLFEIYPNILMKAECSQPPQPTILCSDFPFLVEIWNFIACFPQYFEFSGNITIQDTQSIIVNEQYSNLFSRILMKLIEFQIRQFCLQDIQKYSDLDGYPFLMLMKFMHTNGCLNQIIQFCWVKLLSVVINFYQQNMKCTNRAAQLLSYLQSKLTNLDKAHYIFQKQKRTRIALLCVLVNIAADTNSFRTLIALTYEGDNLNNQTQKDIKLYKKKLTNFNSYYQQQKSRLNKLLHRVDAIRTVTLQNQIASAKSQVSHIQSIINQIEDHIDYIRDWHQCSKVELLGEDADHNLFWAIMQEGEKIFIEYKKDNKWGYYSPDEIEELLDCLNRRGTRQSHLYDQLQKFWKLNVEKSHRIRKSKNLCQVPDQFDFKRNLKNCKKPYNVLQIPCFSFASIQLLILQVQEKLTKHFQSRKAKWGSFIERKQFIDSIQTQHNSIENISRVLMKFNRSVEIIQVRQKSIGEPTIRKVHTKFWGLSDKISQNWMRFAANCQCLIDLHFLVSALVLNTDKYTSTLHKFFKEAEVVSITGVNNEHPKLMISQRHS